MTEHEAACSCGQLRLVADGDPVRVSVCHCHACQRRSGSPFGAQGRFDEDKVRVTGEWTEYVRISDDGQERAFRFCPRCGATVFYVFPDFPGSVAVPVGAFADPGFPAPTRFIFEERRHPWVHLGTDAQPR